MLDYAISSFYPDIKSQYPNEADRSECCKAFLREVTLRTAQLVAQWQAVGFCHGVLNTDNMSIIGLTIDYGPFGWMDRFDPGHVCNHSDDRGRYSYERQPDICKWNCMKLAEAMIPVLSKEQGEEAVACFEEEYHKCWLTAFRKKLGLQRIVSLQEKLEKANLEKDETARASFQAEIQKSGIDDKEDKALIEELLAIMHETGADFTDTFRGLARIDDLRDEKCTKSFLDWLLPGLPRPDQLAELQKSRMPFEQLQTMVMIGRQSPGILSQLGISPEVLLAEMRSRQRRRDLCEMSAPAKKAQDKEKWSEWTHKYWQRLLHEVSQSAEKEKPGQPSEATVKEIETSQMHRAKVMKRSNPHTVLRNYVAQSAIDAAEAKDFTEVRRVLELLQDPYSADMEIDLKFIYDKKASSEEAQFAEIRMSWLNHKRLPLNETLTLLLPEFSCNSRGDVQEKGRLDLGEEKRFRAMYSISTPPGFSAAVLKLKLIVLQQLDPGDIVTLVVPQSCNVCIPARCQYRFVLEAHHTWTVRLTGLCCSGLTWKQAREQTVPAEGGWYQIVIAEEYKGPPPDWATDLCVSCSS